MPHVLHARKAVPARKGMRRSPHRPGDPAREHATGGAGWGGLLVGAAGCVFVAYVWNVGGLHASLDEVFGGWNHSLRSHDDLVAKWYLAALPVLGMALAVIVVYTLLSRAAGKVNSVRKRRKKRKETPVATARPAVAGAEFVRPVRLVGARDASVLVETER